MASGSVAPLTDEHVTSSNAEESFVEIFPEVVEESTEQKKPVQPDDKVVEGISHVDQDAKMTETAEAERDWEDVQEVCQNMSGDESTVRLAHNTMTQTDANPEGVYERPREETRYEPASAIEDAAAAVAGVISEGNRDVEWANVLSATLLDLSKNSLELHGILCRHRWDQLEEVDEEFAQILDCDDLLSDLHYTLLGDHDTPVNETMNTADPAQLENTDSDDSLPSLIDHDNCGKAEQQHSAFDSQQPLADNQTTLALERRKFYPTPTMPKMKPPWEAVADRASGKIYYWNRKDFKTTWDPPLAFIIKSDEADNPGQHHQQHTPTLLSTLPVRKDLAELRTAWDGIQYSFPEYFTQYGSYAQEFWSKLNGDNEQPNCLQEALNFSGPNRVSHRSIKDGSSLSDAAAALGITTQECQKVAFFRIRDLNPSASFAILGTAGKGKFHACSNIRDRPVCFEHHAFVIHVGLTLWYAPSNSGPCGVKLNTLYKMSRAEWEPIDDHGAASTNRSTEAVNGKGGLNNGRHNERTGYGELDDVDCGSPSICRRRVWDLGYRCKGLHPGETPVLCRVQLTKVTAGNERIAECGREIWPCWLEG